LFETICQPNVSNILERNGRESMENRRVGLTRTMLASGGGGPQRLKAQLKAGENRSAESAAPPKIRVSGPWRELRPSELNPTSTRSFLRGPLGCAQVRPPKGRSSSSTRRLRSGRFRGGRRL